MAKNLLLEIGTEEIPAKFLPSIIEQLKGLAQKHLTENLVSYDSVIAYATPRRMTFIVNGVEEEQAKNLVDAKGPAIKIAYNADGTFSKAVLGFLRGQGMDADVLTALNTEPALAYLKTCSLEKSIVKEVREQDNYVYAVKQIGGRKVAELLPEVLFNIINAMNFPKSMRWADLDFKFVRPIHWIVALFDKEVIDFEIANIKSGKTTFGHRFLSKGEITINSADEYITKLNENFVIVEQDKRRSIIRQQVTDLAKSKGGNVDIDENLLEEVVHLVEYPTALAGNFDQEYLSLPKEVIVTPMREHQRYFPVLGDNDELLPLFITVRNGGDKNLAGVANGNERVLRARLSDAAFFFTEDKKVPLAERFEKLKTVVFQDGLGNVYDKSQRLRTLTAFFVENAKLSLDSKNLDRVAELSKTDLVTGMVNEFTELQGVMGCEYAKFAGEQQEVCTAIYEQYLPRFAGDQLPQSDLGKVISIMDKLDNIVATFSRGLIPTGSQDPYFLRRQAIGVVHILSESSYNVSLLALMKKCMQMLSVAEEKQSELLEQLVEFFQARIKNILLDDEIRYDLIDAVLASGIDNVAQVFKRARALQEFASSSDQIKQAVQAFTRVSNISKKASDSTDIAENLLTEPAEIDLYKVFLQLEEKAKTAFNNGEYKKVLEYVTELSEPINVFFDSVMVMVEDEKIKNNRLTLMKKIASFATTVADLSCVVDSETK